MEESPAYTVSLIRNFLDTPQPAPAATGGLGEARLAPAEYKFPEHSNQGTGGSGIAGMETVVLKGDPNRAGVYTIMLRVPPHKQIAAHSHRDDRVATVISGTWHFGYGGKFDEAALKTLPPGSFYTEPPGQTHFAETGDEAVVVQITGFGPSSTTYVDPAQDPRTQR
jgi:quercetin dioxygenase-like cupin family protein